MRKLSTIFLFFFFFNDTATTEIYTLSLHDALPIWQSGGESNPETSSCQRNAARSAGDQNSNWKPIWKRRPKLRSERSEEHTSELQSPCNLVCRLLLEKKKTSKDEVLPLLTDQDLPH